MPLQFFDITRQNSDLKSALSEQVSSVINSGRYILGENVSALEKEIAKYVGTKEAVGVSSGTEALHLALRAAGVGPGDEVITSPFTFVATAEAIAYCGATPIFVDIEPNSFNIEAYTIEQKISKKTKAILPIHLYGQACQMDSIMEVAKAYKLKVVEDCAQAFGATWQDKQVGSFGDAGAHSFFPTKNLGCFGDGGMVTTNDERFAAELRVLRGHGSRKTYHYDIIGYNSRLDEIQAAILRVKLPHLDHFIENRRHNANIYHNILKNMPSLQLPPEICGSKHTYNQYVVRVEKRDQLIDHLKAKGIPTMVYYPLSLHLQVAFANLGYKPGDFPICEKAQNEVLALPIFPELNETEIHTVATAIKEFLS
ncbi:hypothetical protein A2311_06850 [candidate division WOR-1 bacterium RIFOXYB2_FULL_48_7]|uniref:Transcriptional regulator n=1 Tax=candidate division WOR-1 bacterium RIFOXYB2_FULL_48_7 TaxID=1802583 RepID=A0A1F4TVS9_UNCSA|nr:MAG: hypothetical protein A2311_06850 [candidate division WOR-1 bacterium RIFOXYB2_FULL_48_7]